MPALMTPAGRALLGNAPFTPASIAGLKLWLDASRITGLVDGDPVATWSDLSGNGSNAAQGTASKKPTYKVNILNALPGVSTDGVDDCLQVASLTLNTFCSIYLVGSGFTSSKQFFMELSPTVNSNDGNNFYGSNSSTWNVRRTVNHSTAGVSNWFGSAAGVATFIYNGAGAYYLNGTVQANGAITGSALTDSAVTAAFNLASRNQLSLFSSGYWHELCIYNGAHSAAQQLQVQAYLRRKWSTP